MIKSRNAKNLQWADTLPDTYCPNGYFISFIGGTIFKIIKCPQYEPVERRMFPSVPRIKSNQQALVLTPNL